MAIGREAMGIEPAAPAPSKISPRVTTPSASTMSALRVTGVAASAGAPSVVVRRAARKAANFMAQLFTWLAVASMSSAVEMTLEFIS